MSFIFVWRSLLLLQGFTLVYLVYGAYLWKNKNQDGAIHKTCLCLAHRQLDSAQPTIPVSQSVATDGSSLLWSQGSRRGCLDQSCKPKGRSLRICVWQWNAVIHLGGALHDMLTIDCKAWLKDFEAQFVSRFNLGEERMLCWGASLFQRGDVQGTVVENRRVFWKSVEIMY